MKYIYLLPTGKPGNFGAIQVTIDKLLKIVNNHSEKDDKFHLLLSDSEALKDCVILTTGTLKEIKEFLTNENNQSLISF